MSENIFLMTYYIYFTVSLIFILYNLSSFGYLHVSSILYDKEIVKGESVDRIRNPVDSYIKVE